MLIEVPPPGALLGSLGRLLDRIGALLGRLAPFLGALFGSIRALWGLDADNTQRADMLNIRVSLMKWGNVDVLGPSGGIYWSLLGASWGPLGPY